MDGTSIKGSSPDGAVGWTWEEWFGKNYRHGGL